MGLRIRHTANKKVYTPIIHSCHLVILIRQYDRRSHVEKERPFHLQCYYIRKKFKALKMDRKAILAVVKPKMKNIAKNTKNLSVCVFFCCCYYSLKYFHQNCDISPCFLWSDHTCRIISSNRKCIDQTAVYCADHSTVWYYSTFHFQTNSQTLQSLSLKLLCLFLMGWWCCQHWKVSHIMLYETCLLYKYQWNTRWAFARKLDIFTCENNMLSSHMKISPLLWLHNKPHLLTKKLFY